MSAPSVHLPGSGGATRLPASALRLGPISRQLETVYARFWTLRTGSHRWFVAGRFCTTFGRMAHGLVAFGGVPRWLNSQRLSPHGRSCWTLMRWPSRSRRIGSGVARPVWVAPRTDASSSCPVVGPMPKSPASSIWPVRHLLSMGSTCPKPSRPSNGSIATTCMSAPTSVRGR